MINNEGNFKQFAVTYYENLLTHLSFSRRLRCFSELGGAVLFSRTIFLTTPKKQTAFAELMTWTAAPVGVGAAIPNLKQFFDCR